MLEKLTAVTKSFDVHKRYVHLPVRTGAPMRRVRVVLGDFLERTFEIELAESEPDWWAFIDLTAFHGETITMALEGAETSTALDAIHQSDRIVGEETIYREARRPQLRFSSRRGWLNDPNGLVFYEGEYHLFYQHNPYGCRWANMHWGHAVSPDLVHWKELPIALYPDDLGGMYSGFAVVDWSNTAGFQHGSEPALVAIYTAGGKPHSQCIAHSNDRGRTWQKYPANPVLPSLTPWNRDPKVFWYAPAKKWVMALYLDQMDPDDHPEITPEVYEPYRLTNTYGLFSSPDLKRWEKMSEISLPEDGECPELFELPIQGSIGETRWIFFGGSGRYLIGSFDGEAFTTESGPHFLHEGDSGYASQTFNDIPPSDGRRILIAWGMTPQWNAAPTQREPVFAGMPFNQSMSLPVEVTLRSTGDGLRLFIYPVRELRSLRLTTNRIAAQTLRPGDDPLSGLRGELWEIEADIAVGDATRLVFEVRDIPVTYDVDSQELSCLEQSVSLELVDGRIQLRIFVDRTAIDIFGNDGRLYMPMAVDLSANSGSLSIRVEDGNASIHELDVHELTSIWHGLGTSRTPKRSGAPAS